MEGTNAPESLKGCKQWVIWRYEYRLDNTKPAKVPYNPNVRHIKNEGWRESQNYKRPIIPEYTGAAKTNDQSTWADFFTARDALKSGIFIGLGVMLHNNLCGIDIDNCIDKDGKLSPLAKDIIDIMNSYTEISPSGTGIHILFFGNVKFDSILYKKNPNNGVEIYNQGRYFTFTGKTMLDTDIEERSIEIDFILQKYMRKDDTHNSVYSNKTNVVKMELTDEEIIEKASKAVNGGLFQSLWAGDITNYESQSNADLALCSLLAFYCKDFSRIDQLFRKSGLYREKWERVDYRENTIRKAINSNNNTYNPGFYKSLKDKVGNKNNNKNNIKKENDNELTNSNWIQFNSSGKPKINCSLLAAYITQTCNYLIVRKKGYDRAMLYWFEDGYFKRLSVNEFKGKIKKYIPVDIRKSHHWEEVYKNMITDKTEIKFEDLDPIENLVCFKNGVYSVKDKKLIGFEPKYLQTIQLNAKYTKDCNKPTLWLSFIKSLCNNDNELINVMQEWTGLAISNYDASKIKSCLLLYGSVGNTGKTKYLNMLREILGDENICSVEIQNLSSRFGIGELYGKRANLVDDQSSLNITEISKFKSIIGGGITKAEHKYLPSFNFIFKGVFIMASNDLPKIMDDNGEHLYQRFMIVPCNNVVPENERDPDLLDKLLKEKDGIILWALEGLERLINNQFRFTHSSIIDNALEEFRGSNDSFYNYITSIYTITKNDKDRIRKCTLESEYINWCEAEGFISIDKKDIKMRAAKIGISCKRMNDSIYYRGLIKN